MELGGGTVGGGVTTLRQPPKLSEPTDPNASKPPASADYFVIIFLSLVSIPPLPQPHSTPHHPLHLSLSSNPPILRFYSTLHPHPTPLHTVTPQPTRPPTLISTLLHLSHPPPFHPHPKKQITNLGFQDCVCLSSPSPEKTRHFVNLFCGPFSEKTSPILLVSAVAPFVFLFFADREKPHFASLCWGLALLVSPPQKKHATSLSYSVARYRKTSLILLAYAVAVSLSSFFHGQREAPFHLSTPWPGPSRFTKTPRQFVNRPLYRKYTPFC